MIERKHADANSNDAGFIAALDAMPIPCAIALGGGGELLYINDLGAKTLGEPVKELIGRRTEDFVPDLEVVSNVIGRLDAGENVQLTEVTAKLASGKQVRLLLSFQAIRFHQQDCFLINGINISELRRVQEQLRTMLEVQERERRWLGLEIHDGLVQNMTGALMFVDAAGNELEAGRKDDAQNSLERCSEMLRETMLDARALINGLRPPVLEEHGLLLALENLCLEMNYVTGAEFQIVDAEPPEINKDLESVVYRIAQEALANVRKHSGADKVELELRALETAFSLRVSDNGRGLGEETEPFSGVGLGGIQERVELLGGTVTVETAKMGGVELTVIIPYAG